MIRLTSIAAFCLASLPGSLAAQAEVEFAELIGKTQERIEQTLGEYESFLQKTQSEKLDLVTQVNKLENSLVRLRQKELTAERDSAEALHELNDLEERIRTIATQTDYSNGVLSEYLTNFESRIHIAEDQQYLEPLRDIRDKLGKRGDNPAERLPILFETLELGLERQEKLIGGTRFEGRAISPSGGVQDGTIAIIGPVAYFASSVDASSGPLRFNSGTIEPRLISVEPEAAKHISNLLLNSSGTLPLDGSLGSAHELKKAKGSLQEHISKGGWVGYSILALGGLTLLVAIYKLIDLRSIRVEEPSDIGALAQETIQNPNSLPKNEQTEKQGPTAQILNIGIEFSHTDTDTQLDAMESIILRYRPRLERFLPILATTAAVAPLMGLLGTVVGMIKTFTLIEVFGTGDAKSLSSGISEALVTTELGLIVAIPALIFHGVFVRIMRSRLARMEQIASDFSRQLFAAKEAVKK